MSVSDDPDVIELLRSQHRHIRKLLDQLKSGVEPRSDLFDELVAAIAAHETAEEQIVHPVACKTSVGTKVVESRLREENEIRQSLAELYDLGVDHPDFDAKLATLAYVVVAHMLREENEEFGPLSQECPQDKLRMMAVSVLAVESTAPARRYPYGGQAVLSANLVVGPPWAVFAKRAT